MLEIRDLKGRSGVMAVLGNPERSSLPAQIRQAGLTEMYQDVEERLHELFYSYKIEPSPSGKRIELPELMISGCGSTDQRDDSCRIYSAVSGDVLGGVFGPKTLLGRSPKAGSYTCLRLCDGSRLRILITDAQSEQPQLALFFSGDSLIAKCQNGTGRDLLTERPYKGEAWNIVQPDDTPIASVIRTHSMSLHPFVFTFRFADGREPWFRIGRHTGFIELSKETWRHNLKELMGLRDVADVCSFFLDQTSMTRTEQEVFVLANLLFRFALYRFE